MARRSIDVRGRSCPIPIVELMRAIREGAVGDEIEVLADDRAFPSDVRAWCNKTGHQLLSLGERSGGHAALVRKQAP
ncbi:MAG TPA: sulfurtransferase TusA family protein [Polyangiaceae bacterium]|jgi:tRNA 2-thiouridine synthesizing protein A